MSKRAESVAEFETFLAHKGLKLTQREDLEDFGDVLVEYQGERLAVRVGSDRSIWYVEVSEPGGHGGWWEPALLRDLLDGNELDEISLEAQFEILRSRWDEISAAFDSTNAAETHARLARLRRRQLNREIPGLFPEESES